MPPKRTDIKIEIIRTGKHQYEIAEAAGIPETALSAFIQGRRTLPPEQETRLRQLLRLPVPEDALVGMEIAGGSD